MDALCKRQGDRLLLRCYLQPRASRDEFAGIHGDSLKIRITAPPIDGKANKHLARFIAKQFGVSLSQVELIKGGRSRHKLLAIESPTSIPSCLSSTLSLDCGQSPE